jgi:hypothetical protein
MFSFISTRTFTCRFQVLGTELRAGRSGAHRGTASESDGGNTRKRDVQRNSDRNGANYLSVEQERIADRRRHGADLHNGGDYECGQRRKLHGDRY